MPSSLGFADFMMEAFHNAQQATPVFNASAADRLRGFPSRAQSRGELPSAWGSRVSYLSAIGLRY